MQTITIATPAGPQTANVYGEPAAITLLAYIAPADGRRGIELWRIGHTSIYPDGVYYRHSAMQPGDYIWAPDGTLTDLRWEMYDTPAAIDAKHTAWPDATWLA